jgi:hypothetical protein
VNAHLNQIPGSWGIYLSADLVALTQVNKAGNVVKTIYGSQP